MLNNAIPLAQDLPPGWMRPDLGPGVGAWMSARAGGISLAPYAQCNLGDHVSDDPAAVATNREAFKRLIHAEPCWLTQVHGAQILRLTPHNLLDEGRQHRADGVVCTEPGLACTVMVADCLPLLLAAPEGRGVAALHAGWRGLAGAGHMAGRGVLHTGVHALCEAAACEPSDLRVWLGPCIGPNAFEVGADVLMAFGVDPSHPQGAGGALFQPLALNAGASPKWLADLPGLARRVLVALGVRNASGGTWCTVADSARFFSFRRDGVTGRQAASIAILPR